MSTEVHPARVGEERRCVRKGNQPPDSGRPRSHVHLRRVRMMTKMQAVVRPTLRIRKAAHPFSTVPVRTLKFSPQKPVRNEMGRKMVATVASRRLTTAK